MNQVETRRILLSKTQFDKDGGETVFATISNDWAKDANGRPIPGKESSYRMSGFQLHGPIPKERQGGFQVGKQLKLKLVDSMRPGARVRFRKAFR
jgi:hypothetical protein